ncbi:hypothetical protein BDP27DRAFT_1177026, partial [Rhodocollybia butyracea]
KQCPGLILTFPASRSPHSIYPFGLHDNLPLPWGYTVQKGSMFLISYACTGNTVIECCNPCHQLKKHSILIGIIERISTGVSENAPFAYHRHAGMVTLSRRKSAQIDDFCLQGQNVRRKLAVREGGLDEHKWFVLAIADGRYERVDRLIR